MPNYIIQRVFRPIEDGDAPIREVLAGGYVTKEGAVSAILEHFPNDISYKMFDHSGNKRRRVVMEGQDLFYEITEIGDLNLVEDEPWDLPKEAADGPDSKE